MKELPILLPPIFRPMYFPQLFILKQFQIYRKVVKNSTESLYTLHLVSLNVKIYITVVQLSKQKMPINSQTHCNCTFLPPNKVTMTCISLNSQVNSHTLPYWTYQQHFLCSIIPSSSTHFLPLGSGSPPPRFPPFAHFQPLPLLCVLCQFLLIF